MADRTRCRLHARGVRIRFRIQPLLRLPCPAVSTTAMHSWFRRLHYLRIGLHLLQLCCWLLTSIHLLRRFVLELLLCLWRHCFQSLFGFAECPINTYAAAGDGSCSACPAGDFAPAGSSVSTACGKKWQQVCCADSVSVLCCSVLHVKLQHLRNLLHLRKL